jgi:hypothetical protein
VDRMPADGTLPLEKGLGNSPRGSSQAKLYHFSK